MESSSFVNQYFDHVYVLNLKKRTDRRFEMMKKLEHLGIEAEFAEAINGYAFIHQLAYEQFASREIGGQGSHPLEQVLGRKAIENPGAWGCLLSYMRIWEDAQKRGFRRILCLEDDAVFHHDFEQEFRKATQIIPDDWKMLYLGATQRIWEIPKGFAYPDQQKKHFDPQTACFLPRLTNGSFAVGFDASVLELLLKEGMKMHAAVDIGPMMHVAKSFPNACYVLWPNLVIADVTDSDIRGKRDQNDLAKKVKWKLADYDFRFQLSDAEKQQLAVNMKTLPQMKKLDYRPHRNILLEKHKAIFYVLPKNGCSSIKSQLLEPLGMEKKADFPQHIHQPELYPFPFASQEELSTIYESYFKFAIVRNPFSRLVSCFKDKIRPPAYQAEGYKDGVAQPLQRFGTFYGGMSFEAFVDAVCDISDSVADPHFCSQLYQLLDDEGELRVNYIGRLESLERSLQEIAQKTGLKLTATNHLNKTHEKAYQEFYTEALKEKVRKRFSVDIAFLGYTFDTQNELQPIGLIDETKQAYFSQAEILVHILGERSKEQSLQIKTLKAQQKDLLMANQKLLQSIQKMKKRIQQLSSEKTDIHALQVQNKALKASFSWKITAPLRKIAALIKP